ncbi:MULTISPECIES: ThuA domain-containing protein [Streptacidiphilus]|uniref:ThuA domain-containing protein n=1 Tax=Streptacidiphilus cavernicola TaxID=3342716 RepID=A0ABV6UR59_9ACTN|nr:ThuA domain-containing protein [Streptacidiphilus jeojiense]
MPPLPRVLLFTRTAGFRHDSIPAGIAALGELAAGQGLELTATEDPGAFTEAGLDGTTAVVFLSTTGEVLTDQGRQALERFLSAGGGFLGIHSAAGTEYDWPFYGELLGSRFHSHPAAQPAAVTVEDRNHPATAHLPEQWDWTDEWYDFRSPPRSAEGVRVLATVDESRYQGGRMGTDHPLVWCREPEGKGRSFYTALGHFDEAYSDPAFRAHLLGALLWVCRLKD